ncbi:MAG: ATP-binding protein [Coriobacteriaceae bacterium]|nr:ATP-binding protein [Coriobacteriaceae bacterium]
MADRVVLSVPARGEYAKTVRLTASSLATRAGMTFAEVEEMRMAAEEAFVFVCDRVDEGVAVDIVFTVADDEVVMEAGPVTGTGAADDDAVQRGEYARFILEAVCDELELEAAGAECRVRLVKRSVKDAAGA